MQPGTQDDMMDDLRGIWRLVRPGVYAMTIAFIAAAGANHLVNTGESAAHAEPKAEQPDLPSNYAVNQFILK